MMNIPFKKTILAVLVATLAMAALPVTSVFAQDENPPQDELSSERLERAWARQLKTYERLGRGFENTDDHIAGIQGMIDKAGAKGRDVTALQAALDAFEAALNSSRPDYDALRPIVDTHAGFDENGRVVDAEQAGSTVREMRDGLQALKSSMNGTGRALREAIRAFREANKPAEPPKERDS